MRRTGWKSIQNKMRICGGNEDKRKARKTMMAAAAGIAGAVLLSLTDSGTAGMTAYAFNVGPGMEDHDIIYYQEQPENTRPTTTAGLPMSAPERPVPIRAADSTARKITCTRKARETRRHSSTQKQKTARSTSTIPTAAAAGDSGLMGNGPYISRTEIRSRVSGAM